MSATSRQRRFTRSVEDYLKTIYHLSTGGKVASTSDIATVLGLAPASVSGMIKRLSDKGLLAHVPYRGVTLTEEGRTAALGMIRRHRIIESYLIARLGYDWATVHEEAERLEHAVSDTLIERMADALGNPDYDPHGEPIPTPDGQIEATQWLPLDAVPVGVSVVLRQVVHDDPERLRFLDGLGLRPGAVIAVLDRQPFNGPTTVGLQSGDGADRGEHAIGRELALGLLCDLNPS